MRAREARRTAVGCAGILALSLPASGCRTVRAQVGTGLGLGADVQLSGLVHGGLLIGEFEESGPNYGRPPAEKASYAVVGPFHIAAGDEGHKESRHSCYGVLPAVTALKEGSNGDPANAWPFEVGLALVFAEVRLGFNPYLRAVHDGVTAGGPPPPPLEHPPGYTAPPVELPPPSRIILSPSGYVSGLLYRGSDLRTRGIELQARLDATRGTDWNFHGAYTFDALASRDNIPFGAPASTFHDVGGGGWVTPDPDVPIWFGGDAHAVAGKASYAGGGAIFGFVAGSLGDARLELGGGGVWLNKDTGVTGSARASYKLTPWLDVSALGLTTRNQPQESFNGHGRWRFAWGAEARLGPFADHVGLELRWVGGKRALAIEKMGATVENSPDESRDSFSALLRVRATDRLSVYAGGGYRFAMAPPHDEYELVTGYVGVELSF